MKYVLMLAAIAGVYYYLARQTPVAAVKETVTASEVAPLSGGSREVKAAAPGAYKRSIDRAQEVTGQVQKRNGDGEF